MANETYIYGRHPVSEALRARPKEILRIYVADSAQESRLANITEQARANGIAVQAVTRRALENMVGDDASHQGIAASVVPFQYGEVETMLARATDAGDHPLIVVLDQVQDPHNLGSLIRSAYALGAHGVVIPKDRACEVTPAVVKSSAGAASHIPVARVTNLRRTIDELKKSGLWVVGAAADEGQALGTIDFVQGIVLVIGSEGEGMRKGVAESCDFIAHIPMKGQLGSLNASVAGAIGLYEAARQRSAATNTATVR